MGTCDTACRDFRWPQAKQFNWALDYFDRMAEGNTRPALWIVNDDGTEFKASFAEMRVRANRAAKVSAVNCAFDASVPTIPGSTVLTVTL